MNSATGVPPRPPSRGMRFATVTRAPARVLRGKAPAPIVSLGPDGIVCVHEVCGRAAVAEYAPQMIGLTLEEGKHLLAALQVHLVQAQAEDHSRRRRRCQRCGALRPLKDQRSRRLVSLFGTVEVRAPRFTPCRCAVTCRRTLNPIAEIMPDRCTPEHERTIAKMGSLLPYRRARTLLAELLPLGKPPGGQTDQSSALVQHGRGVGRAASRVCRLV